MRASKVCVQVCEAKKHTEEAAYYESVALSSTSEKTRTTSTNLTSTSLSSTNYTTSYLSSDSDSSDSTNTTTSTLTTEEASTLAEESEAQAETYTLKAEEVAKDAAASRRADKRALREGSKVDTQVFKKAVRRKAEASKGKPKARIQIKSDAKEAVSLGAALKKAQLTKAYKRPESTTDGSQLAKLAASNEESSAKMADLKEVRQSSTGNLSISSGGSKFGLSNSNQTSESKEVQVQSKTPGTAEAAKGDKVRQEATLEKEKSKLNEESQAFLQAAVVGGGNRVQAAKILDKARAVAESEVIANLDTDLDEGLAKKEEEKQDPQKSLEKESHPKEAEKKELEERESGKSTQSKLYRTRLKSLVEISI